ncbi:sterol desaturase family protein [Minwuia sp.]|uniref:sterol desaturase family protein n=1 Tax=Minwuia sp. TaxID=2493630 RepID=UPI003A8F292D
MDFLFLPLDIMRLPVWEALMDDWMFAASLVLLSAELIRHAVRGELNWRLVGDVAVSYGCLAVFVVTFVVATLVFPDVQDAVSNHALFEIPTTWLTAAVCLVLADLTYYAEHRFSHRVNAAWATHSVHHSSPNFNMSVASRFGIMDGFWPVIFHLPLVLIGFDPVLVLFTAAVVLAYQTPLHTELVGRLPRWIEAVFNTPSHHRVHHGSNGTYLDRHYGGILIVWDRLFGTFAEETEPVIYGLVEPIDSNSPLTVLFHGFVRLGRKMATAPGPRTALRYLVAPPEWQARRVPPGEATVRSD